MQVFIYRVTSHTELHVGHAHHYGLVNKTHRIPGWDNDLAIVCYYITS